MAVSRRTFLLFTASAVISVYNLGALIKNAALAVSPCPLLGIIPDRLINAVARQEISLKIKNLITFEYAFTRLTAILNPSAKPTKNHVETLLKSAVTKNFKQIRLLELDGWILPETAVCIAIWSTHHKDDLTC